MDVGMLIARPDTKCLLQTWVYFVGENPFLLMAFNHNSLHCSTNDPSPRGGGKKESVGHLIRLLVQIKTQQ